mmetsp:Transcript_299/g.1020  ORF Transcript_299/g.1020 Transcript_299/m.1020 type:complete len:146 (+) Transcript_299:128-565(+)
MQVGIERLLRFPRGWTRHRRQNSGKAGIRARSRRDELQDFNAAPAHRSKASRLPQADHRDDALKELVRQGSRRGHAPINHRTNFSRLTVFKSISCLKGKGGTVGKVTHCRDVRNTSTMSSPAPSRERPSEAAAGASTRESRPPVQ